jgi:Zn-dependent peptidase ImmA (M78 family)/DNA-binding XRE family transcriptional regulator
VSGSEAQSAAALFDPTRLRLGRQLRRLKRAQLAKRIGVSPAAVSQYESGDAKPRPTILARIALQLSLPISFFASTGRPVPSLDTSMGFFRSLRRSSQVDREAALAQAAILAELVRALELHVVLPDLDLPVDLEVTTDASMDEVEQAADELRARWQLEQAPIENVARLLELHGVIVTRLKLAETVDAFSWPEPERPIVILGSDKGNRHRSRFDAAHELAHLVLHISDPEPGTQALERQAHRFAGAFLLPRPAIETEWRPGRIDWAFMLELKQRWGVSFAAMLYRARDLALISPTAYESAMRQVSRRGWRRSEPGDVGAPEQPALLSKALDLVEKNGIGRDELAAEAHLPASQVQELLGSPPPELLTVSL